MSRTTKNRLWLTKPSIYSDQMSRFVVHNARNDIGHPTDIWLVIDTIEGTAITQNDTREDADKDWILLSAFYNKWPNGNPTSAPLVVNTATQLFTPGYWKDRHFDTDT